MRNEEAKTILQLLGMPLKQQANICIYTLLSLANIKKNDKWIKASNNFMRIHDILVFIRTEYNISYAENSRETFRKQAMHPFRIAAIIEDNEVATNSPNYKYRITDEALELIRSYGSDGWARQLNNFKKRHSSLVEMYRSKRQIKQVPVVIDNNKYTLSTGAHNELQAEIIENFASRFAQGAEVLYLGDTADKYLIFKKEKLAKLGIIVTEHDKLPDVILYLKDKNWVYFIEAVTSVGPMSPKRIIEISSMCKKNKSGKVYVTAFPDLKTYKQFAAELAWETEVWISDNPDHMIHLNGDRFLGPR